MPACCEPTLPAIDIYRELIVDLPLGFSELDMRNAYTGSSHLALDTFVLWQIQVCLQSSQQLTSPSPSAQQNLVSRIDIARLGLHALDPVIAKDETTRFSNLIAHTHLDSLISHHLKSTTRVSPACERIEEERVERSEVRIAKYPAPIPANFISIHGL